VVVEETKLGDKVPAEIVREESVATLDADIPLTVAEPLV
jgi:hypothetical protein